MEQIEQPEQTALGYNPSGSPIKCYDFTSNAIGYDKELIPVENVYAMLEFIDCSKYVFQLEKGEQGLLHYQGRFVLKTKLRMKNLVPKIHNIHSFQSCHLSPTQSAVYRNQDFGYVMKEDTRIDGPWDNMMRERSKGRYLDPENIKIYTEKSLYGFQQQIIESPSFEREHKLKRINIVYDPKGGSGKSSLREMVRYYDLGVSITFCGNTEKLLQNIHGLAVKNGNIKAPTFHPLYIIDCSRGSDRYNPKSALSCQKMDEFYAGVEEIKNGYCVDSRYHFKDATFRKPSVWIFTNNPPPLHLISRHKWICWMIDDERELYEVDERYQPVRDSEYFKLRSAKWNITTPVSAPVVVEETIKPKPYVPPIRSRDAIQEVIQKPLHSTLTMVITMPVSS